MEWVAKDTGAVRRGRAHRSSCILDDLTPLLGASCDISCRQPLALSPYCGGRQDPSGIASAVIDPLETRKSRKEISFVRIVFQLVGCGVVEVPRVAVREFMDNVSSIQIGALIGWILADDAPEARTESQNPSRDGAARGRGGVGGFGGGARGDAPPFARTPSATWASTC